MSETVQVEVKIDPLFLEKVIIKNLFKKNEVRERITPFLKPDIFHSIESKILVKHILKFKEQFKTFPNVNELELQIEDSKYIDHLNDCLLVNTDSFNDDFLLLKSEEFIKQSLLFKEFSEAVDNVDNGKLKEIEDLPDKLRDIVSFSFNTKIGLDLFSEEGEDEMYNHLHNQDKIIPTCLPYLNNNIKGGLHEKSLNLLISSTNVGKTLIMCSMATDNLIQGKKVLYVTLEMSKNMIAERILANLFDINLDDLPLLTREKFKQKFQKIREQFNQNIIIEEFPTKSINANHLRLLLKDLKLKKNFEPEVVYIDYIGIMLPIHLRKDENSYNEQKRISEEVRGIACEFGPPFVSGYQTNRDGADTTDVDLTNIADSFGVAATGDLIIAVIQTDEMREAGIYVWIILKSRFGKNKIKFKVCVDYPKMRIFANEEEIEKMLSKSKPKPKEKDAIDEAGTIALKTLSSSRSTARQNKNIIFN